MDCKIVGCLYEIYGLTSCFLGSYQVSRRWLGNEGMGWVVLHLIGHFIYFVANCGYLNWWISVVELPLSIGNRVLQLLP